MGRRTEPQYSVPRALSVLSAGAGPCPLTQLALPGPSTSSCTDFQPCDAAFFQAPPAWSLASAPHQTLAAAPRSQAGHPSLQDNPGA